MRDTRQGIASAEILSSDTDRQTKNDMLPQGIIYTIIAIPINDQDVDGFKQKLLWHWKVLKRIWKRSYQAYDSM